MREGLLKGFWKYFYMFERDLLEEIVFCIFGLCDGSYYIVISLRINMVY